MPSQPEPQHAAHTSATPTPQHPRYGVILSTLDNTMRPLQVRLAVLEGFTLHQAFHMWLCESAPDAYTAAKLVITDADGVPLVHVADCHRQHPGNDFYAWARGRLDNAVLGALRERGWILLTAESVPNLIRRSRELADKRSRGTATHSDFVEAEFVRRFAYDSSLELWLHPSSAIRPALALTAAEIEARIYRLTANKMLIDAQDIAETIHIEVGTECAGKAAV